MYENDITKQNSFENIKSVENPEKLEVELQTAESMADEFSSEIDKKTETFTQSSEQDIEQANASVGLDVDSVKMIGGEFNLAQKLASINFEVAQLGKVTKQELKTSPDFSKSLETEISAINNIDELQGYIKNVGSITASDGYVYRANELAELISGVKDGKLDIRHITRTHGLRDKVYELISTTELESSIAREPIRESGNDVSQENAPEDFSQILTSDDIENVLEQCQTPEARQKAVDLSTILATHINADPKEISAMTSMLQKIDFNIDSGKELSSEFLTDTFIGIENMANGTNFDNSIDDALKNSLKIFEKQQGVYYHGTNAAAWEDITKSGEIKGENRGFENDLDEISKIVERAGYGGNTEFLGWYKINSSDKLFVSGKCDGVNGTNQYAKNSPEWLNVMTDGAFSRRNYDEAKKVVTDKITRWQNRNQEEIIAGRNNISDTEAVQIMQTFEKYWNKYGKSEPVILKIINQDEKIMPIYALAEEVSLYLKVNGKNSNYNPEDLLPEENEQFIRENLTPAELRTIIKQFLDYKRAKIDERISNKGISVNDIMQFALPR